MSRILTVHVCGFSSEGRACFVEQLAATVITNGATNVVRRLSAGIPVS
jgi:hypothetical protein